MKNAKQKQSSAADVVPFIHEIKHGITSGDRQSFWDGYNHELIVRISNIKKVNS